MKFITKKKKTLFDGDQEQLFTNEQKLKCPNCSTSILFNPIDLKSCSKLSKDEMNSILVNLKGLDIVKLEEDTFIKINNLPLKYGRFSCSQCNKEHIVLFGIGEYQPARFMLIQAAIASPI